MKVLSSLAHAIKGAPVLTATAVAATAGVAYGAVKLRKWSKAKAEAKALEAGANVEAEAPEAEAPGE